MSPATVTPVVDVRGVRGAVVVCVLADVEPAGSVLAHTPSEVPVVVCRDHAELTRALDAVAPADVTILHSRCEVADGWLARLGEIARSDPGIATVSPVAEPVDGLAHAAPRLRAQASENWPRISEPSRECVYVRRSALELVGPCTAGDGTVLDPGFARRCRSAGLWHALAADVLVSAPSPIAANESAAVRRARSLARRLTRPLSVLVDARILDGPLDGTRVHVLEMLAALGRAAADAEVSAFVGPGLPPETAMLLGELAGVRTVVAPAGQPPAARADVVHRPHQVSTPADLAVLGASAGRVLVTQQDLIGYHNPAYFPTEADWRSYRELTELTLAAVDHVLFPSAASRRDALSEELVTPLGSTAIHHGVDHAISHRSNTLPAPSPALAALTGAAETIVCLGTDLIHKNRPFAIRVADALRRDHGWRGTLVLAGPRVRHGSSRAVERRLLEETPGLAETVLDLPALAESERRWLLEQAALVIYPTLQEGFGFLPFEAAAAGLPCLWAPGTAMSELLPDASAQIVPWDATLTAARAARLLREPEARAEWVHETRAASERLRWDATAAALLEVYAEVCAAPPNPGGVLQRREGLMRDGVSEDAMRLVGPGGLLPLEVERPLLALASRPRIAEPAYAALRFGYRLSRRR